ncbi:MAG: T9SS type A sorting domain-containing protein [Bacteroidia bacterium]|nr:T9SS type A sorting domain-containing protein [Bacteroidia bacterium]
MKTSYILLAALSCFMHINPSGAQTNPITNGSFENWNTIPNTGGAMDPANWRSFNQYTTNGNIAGISQSPDVYRGFYSLQITPLKSPSLNDTLTSGIMSGNPGIDPFDLAFSWAGSGFSNPEQTIYGYYKYSPDTAFADSAYLILYATGSGNLWGYYTFTPSATYKLFEVTATGNTAATTNLSMVFYYRSNNTLAVPKGKLLIDELSTDNPNSINKKILQNDARVYPNPAGTTLYISIPENLKNKRPVLRLTTMQGKLIADGFDTTFTGDDRMEFTRKSLPAGMYVATLFADNGEQCNFTIVLQ